MTLMEENLTNKDCVSLIEQEKIMQMMFEFFDTLKKIKHLNGVTDISIVGYDIYVVTEKDDVDLIDDITTKFAQWEATYHIFPELHTITKEEMFYIQSGAKISSKLY